MNRSKESLSEPIFHVRASVGGWKHLFANEACARIIFDSLAHLGRTGKIELFAFVLLPSHLHLICRPRSGEIRRVIDGFADFTAARMTAVLKRRGRNPLLHYLHARSGEAAHGAPVWGELRIEEIRDRNRLQALLNFLHDKPTSSEWRLAAARTDYAYSSACYYDQGREPIIPVADARIV